METIEDSAPIVEIVDASPAPVSGAVPAFEQWVQGPAQQLLAHRAVLCGQSVRHSGGYAAIQRRNLGIPVHYERCVVCVGDNVRSPVFTRLMREGRPQYFCLAQHRGSTEPAWEEAFAQAGWRDVLCLAHAAGEGDKATLTWAAFYDLAVPPDDLHAPQLQELMRGMHRLLSRIYVEEVMAEAQGLVVRAKRPGARDLPALTTGQSEVISLVSRGLTNKEIARALGKSDETVKRQLSALMQRTGTRNRVELARFFRA